MSSLLLQIRGKFMFKRAFVALGVLALSAITISSCSTDPNARKDLQYYLSQQVTWANCEKELFIDSEQQSDIIKKSKPDCTTIMVPANYLGTADTPDFNIRMMRIHKAPASKLMGTIFINPGGPGGSGIEQLQWSNFPEELLNHYNIIGFDPRGVGSSELSDGTQIKCSDTLDYRTYFEGEASPANFEEYSESIPLMDEYYNDCAERNPFWWTLSTTNVVQDLDVMRQVITGDADLNFIGTSYGTTIAGLYVATYPEHVGKIVLDSPTTVDSDPIASAVEDYKALERKLNGYLDYYAAKAGITPEKAWSNLLKFKQLADDDQLVGFAGIYPSPWDPDQMLSSESLLNRGILALNYYPEQTAKEEFAYAMQELEENRSNAVFEYYAFQLDGYNPESLTGSSLEEKELERSNEFEIMTIVNSMDYSPDELTVEEQKEYAKRTQAVAPKLYKLSIDSSGYRYYGEALGLDWEKIAEADDAIPDPPEEPLIRENKSGKKLLIVGSIDEAVTPYQFSKDTAELLKSPLISVESSVHGPAAGYNIACLNKVLVEYFVDDIVPGDMTCKA